MTHAHSHSHVRSPGPAPRGVRVTLAVVLVPLAAATVVGLVLRGPSFDEVRTPPGLAVERANATVVDVHPCRNEVPHAWPPRSTSPAVRVRRVADKAAEVDDLIPELRETGRGSRRRCRLVAYVP